MPFWLVTYHCRGDFPGGKFGAVCKLTSSNPGWIVLLVWLESSGSTSYRRNNRLQQTFEAVVSDSGLNVSSGTTIFQDTRGRLLFGIKRVRTFSDLPSAEGL